MSTLDQQWANLYASGRVRWMAGMVDTYRTRVLYVRDDGSIVTSELVYAGSSYQPWREHDVVSLAAMTFRPDFADPATIGCLLQQAREAWHDPGLHIVCERIKSKGAQLYIRWKARNTVSDRTVNGSSLFDGADAGGGCYTPYTTEPAAILAAIAAAPPKVKPCTTTPHPHPTTSTPAPTPATS